MKEELSFLEIFQDPLLTLIALILLCTLWIILPEWPTKPSSVSPIEIKKEIEKLKIEVASLEREIEELREKIKSLMEEIALLEKLKKGEERKAELRGKIKSLKQEVAKLKILIAEKKKELNRLREKLKEAKKRAEEAKLVKELEQKIEKLKAEIAEKEDLLKKLEDKLKKAEDAKKRAMAKEEEMQKILESLKQQVALEREKIKKLEKDKAQLEEIIRTKPGIGVYTTEAVRGKAPVWFEAVNNRLFLIVDKNGHIVKENYNVETFLTVSNGKVVPEGKLTRKDSAIGETIDEIEKPNSRFQQKLNELDPERYYISFVVRKDSFKIFEKARLIAWRRGFKVGWKPLEGPIYVGTGGEGEAR